MTWFKVDDSFHDHPKVLGLDLAAVGLWTLAGSYCARHLLDGVISDRQIRAIGGTRKQAAKLVAVGLWSVHGDDADAAPSARRYVFNDWSDFQPSRDEVTTRRNEDAERKRAARAARAAKQAQRENVRPDVQSDVRADGPHSVRAESALPDPTRPDPTNKEHLPTNAAATSNATREPQQQRRQPSTHFADGTVIPPEPPNNDPPPTLGALALVHDADAIPTEISAGTRRSPAAVSDTAKTLVRYGVPTGIPRQIQADLAEQVQRLANDRHVERCDIEAGLREWSNRPGAGPRLLPHLVADAARARTTRPTAKSTTDERMAAIQALKHRPAPNENRSIE